MLGSWTIKSKLTRVRYGQSQLVRELPFITAANFKAVLQEVRRLRKSAFLRVNVAV